MVQTNPKFFSKLRTPSFFAFVYACTTVVIALMCVGKYCSLSEVQAKAYAKVPVYPTPQAPFLCVKWLFASRYVVDICPEWAWYCPVQYGQQFAIACCVFATLQQEMWLRRGVHGGIATCAVIRRGAMPSSGYSFIACGWRDCWLEKNNRFANQCCGINEFVVFKSTSLLVLMFTNSCNTSAAEPAENSHHRMQLICAPFLTSQAEFSLSWIALLSTKS